MINEVVNILKVFWFCFGCVVWGVNLLKVVILVIVLYWDLNSIKIVVWYVWKMFWLYIYIVMRWV